MTSAMTESLPPPETSTAPDPPKRNFWQRRLLDPVLALLTQGVTPDKVAATLAVGTVCSMFPFLGTTSALNLGVGLWLRMNQPILQTLNQVLGPLHIVAILLYVRLGEILWRAPAADRFSITEMVTSFAQLSFTDFLTRFGWAGIHAFTAWLLTTPLLLVAIYYPLRPLLSRVATRKIPTTP